MPATNTAADENNNKNMQSPVVCSICCEENKPNLISLSRCCHKSCTDCLVQWIERVEATSPREDEGGEEGSPAVASLPGCPFCRVPLTLEETNSILGRPYKPGYNNNKGGTDTTTANGDGGENEMDELTLQLLQELGSKQCPRCGAWIEKLQGGCDMMECLCGCRFCYSCGALNARCNCTPATHNFWDNVLNRNAGSTPAHEEAPVSAEGDCIDLMSHIRNRKKKDRDDRIRARRSMQRNNKRRECRTVDELTYSAKWLFLPTTTKSLRVLNQILARDRIRGERQPSCFLFGGPDDEEYYLDELVSSARWLFLPVKGAFRVLEQQDDDSVYYRRKENRENCAREQERFWTTNHCTETSARWLFCKNPRKAGFRMLQQQRNASCIRRCRDKRELLQQKEDRNVLEPERVIVNGRWLYHQNHPRNKKKTTTPEDTSYTYQCLKRLFQHQKSARRANDVRKWGLLGISRRPKQPDLEEQERGNAVTLRLLFCSTKKDQIQERKEIEKYGL